MANSTKPMPSHVKRVISTPTSQVVVNALCSSAIGVDVHHDLLVCAWQHLDLEEKEIKTVITGFGCGCKEITDFANWCQACSPDIILMESTGILWVSPYERLGDIGFEEKQLALVNARDVKAVSGRKTEKQDAMRLAECARLGKFSKSFVPAREFREKRKVASPLCQDNSQKQNCTRGANPSWHIPRTQGT